MIDKKLYFELFETIRTNINVTFISNILKNQLMKFVFDMSNRIMRLWKVYGVILSGVFKYISSVLDKLIFVLDCLILRILSQSIIDIDCILKIYRE